MDRTISRNFDFETITMFDEGFLELNLENT